MTERTKRLAGAELWGMDKIRGDLLASGTGAHHLAPIDQELEARQKAGVEILQPASADEWEAAATGATKAADSIIAERAVTRAKATGFVNEVVRVARQVRAGAESAAGAIERGAAAGGSPTTNPGGAPKGVVARLGADPNCTGTGCLYRWMGIAGLGRVASDGPDVIDLVAGDCQLVGDQLSGPPVGEGTFRVRIGQTQEEDTLVVGTNQAWSAAVAAHFEKRNATLKRAPAAPAVNADGPTGGEGGASTPAAGGAEGSAPSGTEAGGNAPAGGEGEGKSPTKPHTGGKHKH